jgi:hypothetical protein
VGNLGPDVDEEILKREFGRFGSIASVKVMWPRDEEQRRRQRNSGFVAFMVGWAGWDGWMVGLGGWPRPGVRCWLLLAACPARAAASHARCCSRPGGARARLAPPRCHPARPLTSPAAPACPPPPRAQKRQDAAGAIDAMNGVMLHDYELKVGWGKAVPIPLVPIYPPGEPSAPVAPDVAALAALLGAALAGAGSWGARGCGSAVQLRSGLSRAAPPVAAEAVAAAKAAMQGLPVPSAQAAPWQSSGGGSGGGSSSHHHHHHHHRQRENPHQGTGQDIEVQVPGDLRIRWAGAGGWRRLGAAWGHLGGTLAPAPLWQCRRLLCRARPAASAFARLPLLPTTTTTHHHHRHTHHHHRHLLTFAGSSSTRSPCTCCATAATLSSW